MRCVVTAGPTFEPLDDVRRLTNFSTGRLGCELAAHLTARGHEVTLLIGEQATYGSERRAKSVEVFTTTADLSTRLQRLSTANMDAVFHAAAVSDFAFGKVWTRSTGGESDEVKSGKFTTRDGTLMAELVPTPKIISHLRDWYPRARLVGWKFEVEGSRTDAIARAHSQLTDCRTDACVVNGGAYGDGFGLLGTNGDCPHFGDKTTLFAALENFVVR